MSDFYSGESPSLTCGDFENEVDSAKAFDEVAEKSSLFKIWKEVTGEIIQPLSGMENKEHFRIDRILLPTEKLRGTGWNKGLIGIEIKKSHIKVGPPLSQMLDYLRCAWYGANNVKVLLDYCFLWPLEKCGGPIASIMAQNHIGGCCLQYPPESEWHRFVFHVGEQYLIEYKLNADVVTVKNLNFGKRTGSR